VTLTVYHSCDVDRIEWSWKTH